MSDTPETDKHDDQYHIGGYTLDFCRKLERERDEALADLEFRRDLYKLQSERLEGIERERDEAILSCHIWQTGHAELVAELNRLQFNQPERKHIGRWGHNKKEFTSPYINQ